MKDIYIVTNGKQTGPYSENEIKDGIYEGKFKDSDLAWKDGMPDWVPLKKIIADSSVTTSKATKSDAARIPTTAGKSTDHDFEDSKADGTLHCLLDTKFNKFVVLRLCGLIYKLLLFFCILLSVGGFLFAFYFYSSNRGSGTGLITFFLVVGSVVIPLFVLIVTRIFMEFMLAMIKTAQNTRKIVEALRN